MHKKSCGMHNRVSTKKTFSIESFFAVETRVYMFKKISEDYRKCVSISDNYFSQPYHYIFSKDGR